MKKASKNLINEWSSRDTSKDAENRIFLHQLKEDKARIHDVQTKIHNDVFNELDCLDCANCCTTTPPIYTTKDVKRIARHLSISPKQFKHKYTIEDIDGGLVGISVPCTFLNDDNTCKIYEVRPLACRTYPHTDGRDFTRRPELNYKNTIVCPAAYHIVKRLNEV